MKLPLLIAFAATLISAQPLRIVLVGDSTVNDEGGWGPGFTATLGVKAEVLNLAKNGRSSKSFRDEGLWAPALAAKADYILIQFGHNDGPGKAPGVEVLNLAKNGRSSKSFRDEGLWAPALAAKADYILIQFGHN